jgi:NifU-like protein involved in Fe-S cluster formation
MNATDSMASSMAPYSLANPFEYGSKIWDLFNEAPRAGRFAAGTPGVVSGQAGTPAARSVLRIELQFAGGRVVDARFGAYGCPTSIAVGAWITGEAIGRTAAELRSIDAALLRATLEIPDDRAHCALLGEDALRAALTELDGLQG